MTDKFKELLGENYADEIKKQVAAEKSAASTTPTTPLPVFGNPEGLEYARSAAMRALMGMGRGFSLGLTDPLAAAALKYTRKLTGGPETSIGDAYSEIKAMNRQMQQMGPAYGLGELVGAGVGGMKFVPSGGLVRTGPKSAQFVQPTARQMIGTGAAMGGITGLTSSETPEEVATNMLLGIGLGGAGGTVGLAGTKVREAGAKKWSETIEANEVRKYAQENMENIFIPRMEAAFRKQGSRLTEADKAVVQKRALDMATQMAREQIERESRIGPLAMRSLRGFGQGVAESVVPASIGGGVGAGVGSLFGVDPYSAIMAGGGLTAAMGRLGPLEKGIYDIGGRILAQYPQQLTRMASGVGAVGQYALTSQLSEQLANARANEAAQEMMIMRQQGQ